MSVVGLLLVKFVTLGGICFGTIVVFRCVENMGSLLTVGGVALFPLCEGTVSGVGLLFMGVRVLREGNTNEGSAVRDFFSDKFGVSRWKGFEIRRS